MLLAVAARAEVVTVPGTYPSIQAALDGAADGSVIQIAPGTYAERLGIANCTRALTVRGDPADPAGVVVDAQGTGATLSVFSCGSTLVFEGMTFTGGRGFDNNGLNPTADGGGLFMADSDAVFRHVVFRQNRVTGDGGGVFLLRSAGLFEDSVFEGNDADRYGGGAMLNIGSTTVFNRCTFVGNRSGLGSDPAGSGGGVHVNDSSPVLVGAVIEGNRGKGSGGGLLVLGHFDQPRTEVTLRQSIVRDNVAFGVPGAFSAEGGGIHVEDNATLRAEQCVLSGNAANNGGGVSTYRGALELRDSRIENNSAPAVPEGGGFGGGVFAQSVNTSGQDYGPASVTIERCAIRGNQATSGGGVFTQGDFLGGVKRAALTLTDSIVADNTASAQGGGLQVDRTDATITGSHVVGNVVTTGAYGGGLLAAGSADVVLRDTTFAANATNTVGGAIYIDQGGHLDVADSYFHDNHAGTSGGVGGGAIGIGQAVGPTAGPVSGQVTGSVFSENGPYDLWESNCDLAQWSTVTYVANAFAATGPVYYRACGGEVEDIAAFNALAGKATGNGSAPAMFVALLAAPGRIVAGDESVVSLVAPAGGVDVDPSVSLGGPVARAIVAPLETTTYAARVGGDTVASTRVEVTCASLGTPIARRPRSTEEREPPGNVALEWYSASGAVAYDVYLDAGAGEPTTLVASDLTGTTLTVPGLPAWATFGWRVVAKSPQCADPVSSSTVAFATCGSSPCAFVDDFADGDASDWTPAGRGRSGVREQRLELLGKRRLALMAPIAPLASGTVTLQLQLAGRGRHARLLFGHRDARNYLEVVLQGAKRWKLAGRADGRPVVLARAKREVPMRQAVGLRLTLDPAGVVLHVDGVEVLRGPPGALPAGIVGIQSVGTQLSVDDVRIEPGPPS